MKTKYFKIIIGTSFMISIFGLKSILANPTETNTIILDKVLTNNIEIQNDEISFNLEESFNLPTNIDEPQINPQPNQTLNILDENNSIIVLNEKIANPQQRYRNVDEYYYINKNTNIYESDTPNSRIIKQAEYADYIHKIGNDPYNNNGFSKIEIDGKEGYVYTELLTQEILFKSVSKKGYALKDLIIYKNINLTEPLKKLNYTKSIEIIGESQNLLHVSYKNSQGYVEKANISNEILFLDTNETIWNLNALNLKSSLDENAKPIKELYKYEAITRIGISEEWSKIKISEDTFGYIKNEDITTKNPILKPKIDIPYKNPTCKGEEIVNYALQFIGNPYVYGGTSLTNGTDCSGFTQSIYKHFGYTLNRSAASQMSNGHSVSYDNVKPGDLIFYEGHVAIYIGNGQIIHASNSAPYPQGGIKISSATYTTIIAIRRITD